MSSLISRVIQDDFVWNAIIQTISLNQRRESGTGFVNICCPLCVARGEGEDRKFRCGIKRSDLGIGVSCFNCGFRALWRPGDLLSRAMRTFLEAAGMPDHAVRRLNHTAASYRSLLQQSPEAVAQMPDIAPRFETRALPEGARSLDALADEGCEDPDFLDAVEYVFSRGDEIARAMTYYWTPATRANLNRRVIVPFRHDGTIVGFSARAIDATTPQRFHMEAQANYLFNAAALTRPDRRYTFLVEGLFDAIAIDAVGLLGAHLNAQQIAWIKSQGRTPILVPDRDRRGAALIDLALEHGFGVAFPALSGRFASKNLWDPDVKDVADAVRRYGRLWTLISLIETTTTNKLEINLKRKALF